MPILKKNLLNLNKNFNYEIVEKDIYNESTLINLNQKFDIIFLDPPYKKKYWRYFFTNYESKILNKCIIILHRHKNELDLIPTDFRILDEKYEYQRYYLFLYN